MTPQEENIYYFGALVDLLSEAELQLKAHGSDPGAVRYQELLDELRSALNTAIAASRFILAELRPGAEPVWPASVARCLPGVH